MEIIKVASSAIDFASHCPLLYKAVSDNNTPTPGYIIEEVIKISFISSQHRSHLCDFLFARLFNSSWSCKQKIVKLLFQLSQKGHHEVRAIIRKRDGDLRKVMSIGGQPDPVLGNTPQLFFNSAVQELLAYVFDPEIIRVDENEEQLSERTQNVSGYGTNASQGKYDGFGSTPIQKPESVVDQVRDMVSSIGFPDSSRTDNLDSYLKQNKGSYQPVSISLAAMSASPALSMHSTLNSSTSPFRRSKGKAGGGWSSDDEDEETEDVLLIESTTPRSFSYKSGFSPDSILGGRSYSNIRVSPSSESKVSCPASEPQGPETPSGESQCCPLDEIFVDYTIWPVNLVEFRAKCTDIVVSNSPNIVLKCIADKLSDLFYSLLNEKPMSGFPITNDLATQVIDVESPKSLSLSDSIKRLRLNPESHSLKEIQMLLLLLFLELGIYGDFLSVRDILKSNFDLMILTKILESNRLTESIKIKAQKINLILKSLQTIH